MLALHADPHRMPSFIDNHDVDRFLAGGDVPALKQALLAMLTLPGIPVIYYGTEQGFAERRASMFAGGVGSGGRDHFDIAAPLYRYLQSAIALRRDHPLFSRGVPTVLADNPAAAGAIAWRTDHDGESALVVLNSAGHASLLDRIDVAAPAGTRLRGLFGIDGTPPDLVVGADGRLTLALPPRSGMVWRIEPPTTAVVTPTTPPPAAPTIDPIQRHSGTAQPTVTGDLYLTGTARPGHAFQLVVDGMKFAPCEPGFVDARNAIIAAGSQAMSPDLQAARSSDGAGYHRGETSVAVSLPVAVGDARLLTRRLPDDSQDVVVGAAIRRESDRAGRQAPHDRDGHEQQTEQRDDEGSAAEEDGTAGGAAGVAPSGEARERSRARVPRRSPAGKASRWSSRRAPRACATRW